MEHRASRQPAASIEEERDLEADLAKHSSKLEAVDDRCTALNGNEEDNGQRWRPGHAKKTKTRRSAQVAELESADVTHHVGASARWRNSARTPGETDSDEITCRGAAAPSRMQHTSSLCSDCF